METYIDYINRALPDRGGDKLLYRFKKKTLDEMTARANEITGHGLRDEQVVSDLVISEYPALEKEYEAYYKKEKAAAKLRRNVILNAVGSVVYLLLVVIAFLGVSFATKRWDMTWAIVVDGVLLWTVYLLLLGTNRFAAMKKIFHIIARAMLMGAVIIAAVAAFIAVVALTDVEKSWVILIFGLVAMFLCDALFATFHQHKLAIFCWLLYLPVMAVFVFIIIGALGLAAWHIAWIVIPLSLVLDVIIVAAAIAKNKKAETEVADVWKES